MLRVSKPSIKCKQTFCGLISLALLCAAIALGFASKRPSQRQPVVHPTAVVNIPAEGKTTIHVSAEPQPQTSAQFDLSHNVIAGGGGSSSNGSFRVDGTVGQAVVGTQMSTGQFSQIGGFWQPQSGATPTPTPTPTATPTPTPTPAPLQLLLDESGPAADQVTALDSPLFLRDPFSVVNEGALPNLGSDRNTRVIIFVTNLQLAPGETSSSVLVSLIDGNNQSYDIAAEDVRPIPNSNFTQVIFRLADNLPAGTCIIRVRAHGQLSNAGTFRIRT